MKKFMLCCAAFLASLTCNAQVVQIIENGNILYEHDLNGIEIVVKEKTTPTGGNTINGHEYVEIGGLKWATMNIGATTVAGDPATCYGDYFAWSETEPRYTSKTYASNSWSFGGWAAEHTQGYDYENPPSYTGTTLDAKHDAATAKWGGRWRTPTLAEFKALFIACGCSKDKNSITPTTIANATAENIEKGIYWCNDYKGVKGLLFCDGNNKLFFPSAGYVNNQTFYTGNYRGSYWSSSIDSGNNKNSSNLTFQSGENATLINSFLRNFGFTIRPVSE